MVRVEAISDSDDDWQTVKVVPTPQNVAQSKSESKPVPTIEEPPLKETPRKPAPSKAEEDWDWSDSDDRFALRPSTSSRKAQPLEAISDDETPVGETQIDETQTHNRNRISGAGLRRLPPPPLPSNPKPKLNSKPTPSLPSNPKPKPSLPSNPKPKPSFSSASAESDSADSENFDWDDFFGSDAASDTSSNGMLDETPKSSLEDVDGGETPATPAILKDDWEHVQPAMRLAEKEKKKVETAKSTKSTKPINSEKSEKSEKPKKKLMIKDPWEDDSDETPTKSAEKTTARQRMNQRMSLSSNSKERTRNESKAKKNPSKPTHSSSPLSSSLSSLSVSKPSNQRPIEDDWDNDSDEAPIADLAASSRSLRSSNRKPNEDDWGDESEDASLPVEAPSSKSAKPSTRRQSMNERLSQSTSSRLTGRYQNEEASSTSARTSNRKPNEDDWGDESDETPTPMASASSRRSPTRRQSMNERTRRESRSSRASVQKPSNRKPNLDDWGDDVDETPVSNRSKSISSSNRKPNLDDWGDLDSDSDDFDLPIAAPPSKIASPPTRRPSLNRRISSSQAAKSPSQSKPSTRKPSAADWAEIPGEAGFSRRQSTRKPDPSDWLESDETPIETLRSSPGHASDESEGFASPGRSRQSARSLSRQDRVKRSLAAIPDFDFLSQSECNPPFFSL